MLLFILFLVPTSLAQWVTVAVYDGRFDINCQASVANGTLSMQLTETCTSVVRLPHFNLSTDGTAVIRTACYAHDATPQLELPLDGSCVHGHRVVHFGSAPPFSMLLDETYDGLFEYGCPEEEPVAYWAIRGCAYKYQSPFAPLAIYETVITCNENYAILREFTSRNYSEAHERCTPSSGVFRSWNITHDECYLAQHIRAQCAPSSIVFDASVESSASRRGFFLTNLFK